MWNVIIKKKEDGVMKGGGGGEGETLPFGVRCALWISSCPQETNDAMLLNQTWSVEKSEIYILFWWTRTAITIVETNGSRCYVQVISENKANKLSGCRSY